MSSPAYGLVCITFSERCRYRALTRARFLAEKDDFARRSLLEHLYWDNIHRLDRVLTFCAMNNIRLYRVSSSIFPMSDEPLGESVLRGYSNLLAGIGRRVNRLGIRVVIHPDQFVVLNSEKPAVVETSIKILRKHALFFDLLGLPKTPWAAMIIHGGKSGRADELVETIRTLPENVRSRLCLENDEYSYSADEILEICKRANVPMIFDNLHHVIHESIDSYDDPSVAKFVREAQKTWPKKEWQLVHLSNGHASFRDRNHSHLISEIPQAYAKVPWIEVEARGKEDAISAIVSERMAKVP